MANVMVILISDVTGTQITFTDQSGNYALTYLGGMSHSLRVLPSRSGFLFNPLLAIFTGSGTITGDRTIDFEGELQLAQAGRREIAGRDSQQRQCESDS